MPSILETVKVVDNKEVNSEIQIKFELDEVLSGSSRGYKCPVKNGYSKDFFECTDTNNDDKIWVKVLILALTFTNHFFPS